MSNTTIEVEFFIGDRPANDVLEEILNSYLGTPNIESNRDALQDALTAAIRTAIPKIIVKRD